ncbi:Serine/threonine-protein kinase PK-1 [Massilia sp. Bi118]|uniref:serine/threonine protein kinase n=1 Tax=Massilia sp. Bi118 TaxID=2822346 RepID=UPI001D4C62AF|nr:serine/threonine-protein kinase [Massilia sp. Bi118]CAH0296560.1 Serine/threonine-protein kinase PK-1 [Massilia sp. Bi118]
MSQTPEDDRTVLATSSPQTPAEGSEHHRPHALPPGTRLGEFEITGVLGEGGFGIVYLAHDSSLERQVALKEYMPSFAWRSTQAHVSVKSSQNADSFEAGLRSFINEARMLAQFDHPALVKVYRFWEANGTAYMVMPYYHGLTLKQTLQERSAAPDEAWLKALLGPLLDAIEVMHQHQCFHRDIAPDNILMLDEGRPLLLDFGAARRTVSGMNQAFTVILKQNYAPIEQYAEMPGMSQGAWTDLYALASVVHFAIDGHAPPPALSRMMADPYVPLASRYAGRYSEGFLQAIDRTLAFRPDDRPQSVAAMRAMLGLDAAPREPVRPAPLPVPEPALVAPPPASSADAPRRTGRLLIAGIGVALLGAAGLFGWSRLNSPQAPAAPAAASAPPVDVARPTTAPPPAAPFSPLAALDAVLAGASPERKVSVQVENQHLRINKDKVGFTVRSAHAGYLYVYVVSTENNFQLLFPNALDGANRIAAGEALKLPRRPWLLTALGPAGTDHFVAMVSDAPRDFSTAGLTEGKPFSGFPLARATQLQAAHTGARPLFAGMPACAAAPCPGDYGAAAFSIEELAQ